MLACSNVLSIQEYTDLFVKYLRIREGEGEKMGEGGN